jgi:hypothetical protein
LLTALFFLVLFLFKGSKAFDSLILLRTQFLCREGYIVFLLFGCVVK